MTDSDKIFYGFLFSAIGTSLGWTLNQLSQWFRTRSEDKKNLKLVLFNLLETYFLFVRSDMDKVTMKVTDKVFESIPKDQQTEQGKMFLGSIYLNAAEMFLKPELLNESKIIEVNYQASIKTLAAIDPLTAYYLSGKTNVLERFEIIQSWFADIEKTFGVNPIEIQTGAKQVLNILKPSILDDTLKELEKDIKSIAWKINPVVWYKSKKAIKRLNKNATERQDKEIDEFLAKLTPLFENNKLSKDGIQV